MDKSPKYEKVVSDLSHYFEGYALSRTGRMSIIASTLSNAFTDWIFCGFYIVNWTISKFNSALWSYKIF